MSYFLRSPMIVVVFLLLVFLENPASGEFSDREESVKWAGYGEEKLSTVVIAGKILCHAEQKPSVNPHAISGARVVVLCGGKKKARKLAAAAAEGSTDASGKFKIDLPSHLHAIPNLEKVCHVRIVNLPETSPCRKACSAKHNKPITMSSIGHGVRTYTTPNIHLSTT